MDTRLNEILDRIEKAGIDPPVRDSKEDLSRDMEWRHQGGGSYTSAHRIPSDVTTSDVQAERTGDMVRMTIRGFVAIFQAMSTWTRGRSPSP